MTGGAATLPLPGFKRPGATGGAAPLPLPGGMVRVIGRRLRRSLGLLLMPVLVACTSTAPAPTAVAPEASGASFITKAPAGYTPLRERLGPFDLERYVGQMSAKPEQERSILVDSGFADGDSRGWVNRSKDQALLVYLFSFEDEAGANLARDRFVAQDRAEPEAAPFEVAGVAGAQGGSFVYNGGQGPERVHAVLFVRGRRLFVVFTQSRDLSATPDDAKLAARSQSEAISTVGR